MLELLTLNFMARSETFLGVALAGEVLARHADSKTTHAPGWLLTNSIYVLNSLEMLLHDALSDLLMIRLWLVS